MLLVYRKKAIGAYLLEQPSGTVTGIKDAQSAALSEETPAEEVSGEDYSGDWGERHDEALGATAQAQQTSGEDYSGDWGERHDEELSAADQAQQTSGEDYSYTDLPLDAEGYPVE